MLASASSGADSIKTAEAILRIPLSRPDRLFQGDRTKVHRLYQRLVSHWHPDRNPTPLATEVFQRISVLYARAMEQMASGQWQSGLGETLLTARDGRQYRIKHFARHAFELGELVFGKAIAAFIIRSDATDLAAAAASMLSRFRFATEAMRQQISPCLPQVRTTLPTHDGCAWVLEKSSDLVLLSDLAQYLGGTVPPVHVAWILSSLYNLACWLEWAGITHNAIGPDTLFVAPRRHTVALYGGWWYSAPVAERLNALPLRTVENIPPDIVRGKIADPRCDLELIRATGRELLGDISGVRLVRDSCIPRPMAQWLRHPSSGSALTDYRIWREVLVASFGGRRFTRLDVTPGQMYSTDD